MVHDEFLRKAAAAARAADHLFPEYAACEAALESGWGMSGLAVQGNNLFGQKQSHPARQGCKTLTLPTREFLHGSWVTVQANWICFPDWEACFAARMQILKVLSESHPPYRAALGAGTGSAFVIEVSQSWSTDPQRAGKVLSLYDLHHGAFERVVEA